MSFSSFKFIIFILIFIRNTSYELSKEKIEELNKLIESQIKSAKLHTMGIVIVNKEKTLYQNIWR